ncbi:MAG: PSD1 and planctomycete cytochrome C domain-containing protein [Gemmataceae bacterium]|nr:PSD1 and planctomycete cytochrome C domain-containing protein [Gemmataceae bacterium]
MRRSVRSLSLLAAALALVSRPAPTAEPRPAAPAQAIDFTRDVRPILQGCVRCHGGVKRQNGLSFLRREDALAPARSGERAIVPGKPQESELLRRVTAGKGERMPPDGKPLSPEQVEALSRWIASGAPWEPHWAFAPLRRPAPPPVRDRAWPRNPIDSFVLHRLEAHRLRPSPEADRYTLLRRLHLDLTGLPPSIEDADAFLRDASPDAYEKAVDRLLASPHFGERWGRHWLDLARYADSDGYEVDKVRPHAWYWRDWVLRAVNEDMPFDQFTVEQLAGDLLPLTPPSPPAGGEGGVRGATFSQRLATAFHRQTLTNNEGGIDKEEYRVKAVIDRVHTTAAVWLGLTAGCAQCHDHPHDPLRQREFFQLYAIFNNADEADLPLAQLRNADRGMRNEDPSSTPQSAISNLQSKVRLAVLAERAQPRTTYLFQRGDFLRPRKDEAIAPGVPSLLHSFRPRREGAPADRLDLARWLVDPANPLTPRVAVNHVWRHLFGHGLVRTPDDFGARGEPPTHPELLDWLAGEFVRQGWSRKRLIRLIVTSATYRQSSRHRPELAQADPANRLLHRQNRFRVEAEIVRDLHLAAGGLLAPRVGGPSVFPPIPKDLAKISFRSQLPWPTSTGADRYRRGLYTFFKRSLPDPNLVLFDCPDASASALQRGASNTPLQALATLNNEVFVEAAQGMARRVLRAGLRTDLERVRFAFRLALARPPTDREQGRLLKLLQTGRNWYRDHAEEARQLAGESPTEGTTLAETAAWVVVANVLLNLDEFITRE